MSRCCLSVQQIKCNKSNDVDVKDNCSSWQTEIVWECFNFSLIFISDRHFVRATSVLSLFRSFSTNFKTARLDRGAQKDKTVVSLCEENGQSWLTFCLAFILWSVGVCLEVLDVLNGRTSVETLDWLHCLGLAWLWLAQVLLKQIRGRGSAPH